MLICQYSGGLDGFLSTVFWSYREKTVPDLITDGEVCQPPLFSQIVTVSPDEAKALRVERGIYARLGDEGLQHLGYAYASSDPDRNQKLLYWILSVFKYGCEVQKRFHDPHVLACNEMVARVTYEIDRMRGFLRFAQTEEGLFCAEFAPDHDILTFLMPHFVRRFNDTPFLIHDCKRDLYGLYNCSEWKVLRSEERVVLRESEPEKAFRSLWQEYYRAVRIASRENRKLQDAYLPRRYRAFLTELREDSF